ncbi:MAG TPA: TIGR02186 family protein [Vicinamibacteria bacterium]|nr:TIGR02186 family protein [Vicinamibacteria bacterium]
MSGALALVLTALAATSVGLPEPAVHLDTRRVPISLSFSGQQVFLSAQLPPECDSALAIMEGPPAGFVRLMRKGRLVVFWMGVRQYKLAHLPELYLVDLHCPLCNGMGECPHQAEMAALSKALKDAGLAIGPEAIASRARLEVLGGHAEPGEAETVAKGYWQLQESRGVYGLRGNAIRISPDRLLYHVFNLGTKAPEGKYRISTYFLRGRTLVAMTRNDLFVRQSGLVSWLSRLAERHALVYGAFTVLIALSAGLLAGVVFKRGAKH